MHNIHIMKDLLKSWAALVLLALLASCSVKEDRTRCASILHLDLRGHEDYEPGRVVVSAWDTRDVLAEDIRADVFGHVRSYPVPRGKLNLSAYSPTRNIRQVGRSLLLDSGKQMDSLFAYGAVLDTDCEELTVTAPLRKQFATLTVTLDGDVIPGSRLEVHGASIGTGMIDMTPIEGEFLCTVGVDESGTYRVRLPRQDATVSLRGEILLEGGDILDAVEIGDILERSGFDWKAEDLADATIKVDRVRRKVNVIIVEWKTGISTEVII